MPELVTPSAYATCLLLVRLPSTFDCGPLIQSFASSSSPSLADNASSFLKLTSSPSLYELLQSCGAYGTPSEASITEELDCHLASLDSFDSAFTSFKSSVEAAVGVSPPPPTSSSDDGRPPLSRRSVYGVYVRSVCLNFGFMPFETVAKLYENVLAYRDAFGEHKERVEGHMKEQEKEQQHGQQHERAGDASIPPYESSHPPPHPLLSLPSASLLSPPLLSLCLRQPSLVGLVPLSVSHTSISRLLSSRPELPLVHFLQYLHSIHTNSYATSIDALHRYFDYAFVSSDRNSHLLVDAVQALAGLYDHFGHKDLKNLAIQESVRVAQQAGDYKGVAAAQAWQATTDTGNADDDDDVFSSSASRPSSRKASRLLPPFQPPSSSPSLFRFLSSPSSSFSRLPLPPRPSRSSPFRQFHRSRLSCLQSGRPDLAATVSIAGAKRALRVGGGEPRDVWDFIDRALETEGDLSGNGANPNASGNNSNANSNGVNGRGPSAGNSSLNSSSSRNSAFGQSSSSSPSVHRLSVARDLVASKAYLSFGHKTLASLKAASAGGGGKAGTTDDEEGKANIKAECELAGGWSALSGFSSDLGAGGIMGHWDQAAHGKESGPSPSVCLHTVALSTLAALHHRYPYPGLQSSSYFQTLLLADWALCRNQLPAAAAINFVLRCAVTPKDAYMHGSGSEVGDCSLSAGFQRVSILLRQRSYESALALNGRLLSSFSPLSFPLPFAELLLQRSLILKSSSPSTPLVALSSALAALGLATSSNLDELHARCVGHIAALLLAAGNEERATNMLQRCLPKICEHAKAVDRGFAYLTLAKCRIQAAGRSKSAAIRTLVVALRALSLAKESFEEGGDREGQREALHLLACVHAECGERSGDWAAKRKHEEERDKAAEEFGMIQDAMRRGVEVGWVGVAGQ